MSKKLHSLCGSIATEVNAVNDIITRIVPLPNGVRGCTAPDENGDYNVYISEKLDPEDRAKAFRHEIEHIKRLHFQRSEKSVAEKESEIPRVSR